MEEINQEKGPEQFLSDDIEAKKLLEALEMREVKDGGLSEKRAALLAELRERFSNDPSRSEDYQKTMAALAFKKERGETEENIVLRTCPNCGQQITRKQAVFCSHCGTNLETGETVEQRQK